MHYILYISIVAFWITESQVYIVVSIVTAESHGTRSTDVSRKRIKTVLYHLIRVEGVFSVSAPKKTEKIIFFK